MRGLDYYVRTTFEVTSDQLGAQSSVLGGGRYDGLVKDLGGPDAAGIGFAVGMERLALLLPPREAEPRCDVFLMPLAAAALDRALRLQRELRGAGVAAMLDPEGRSFKSRMKQADKLGARFVAILGDDEMARGRLDGARHGALRAAGRPGGEDPRPPEGEGEWLSPWATSSGPTTAGSCARTTSGRRSPSWAGPPTAATWAG